MSVIAQQCECSTQPFVAIGACHDVRFVLSELLYKAQRQSSSTQTFLNMKYSCLGLKELDMTCICKHSYVSKRVTRAASRD